MKAHGWHFCGVKFNRDDLWIGCYRERARTFGPATATEPGKLAANILTLHICVVPCFPLKIERWTWSPRHWMRYV